MNDVLIATRLQLRAWHTSITFQWMVLSMSFAANLAIWGLLDLRDAYEAMTGGLAAIYIVSFLSYIFSMSEVFPLAVGFGLTRRAFFASMSLLAAAQAAAYGLVLTVLAVIERATDGWGVGLLFFRPEVIDTGNLVTQAVVYAVPFVLLAQVGICVGITFKRWGATGVYTLLVLTLAVVVAAIVLITTGQSWDELGRWIERQPVTSLAAAWPLPVIAALAAAGFTTIRRAVP